jgi:hypothetical protein
MWLKMNKRIVVAAVILGLAMMACGFGAAVPTAKSIIGSLLPTAMPPLAQSGISSPGGLPFSDNFTSPGTGWENASYTDGSIGYGNGYYFVKVTMKGDDLYGAAAAGGISDVAISVDAKQFTAPTDNNTAYGVICRLQNDSSNDGYYFRITGDGNFSVALYNNGSFYSLLPGTDEWAAAPSAKPGNVINHLVATCNGSQLTFTVNGTILFTGSDTTFSSGGLGLLGAVYDNNVTAEFHFTRFQAKAP